MSHALDSEPVTVINALTVRVAGSERFLRRWEHNASIMAGKPGFVRAWIYQGQVDGTELRLINVAHWDSGWALEEARADPRWHATVVEMLDDPDLRACGPPVVYQGHVHGRGRWRLMRDPSGVVTHHHK